MAADGPALLQLTDRMTPPCPAQPGDVRECLETCAGTGWCPMQEFAGLASPYHQYVVFSVRPPALHQQSLQPGRCFSKWKHTKFQTQPHVLSQEQNFKQTDAQANKQTNQPTNKQTNKPTNRSCNCQYIYKQPTHKHF